MKNQKSVFEFGDEYVCTQFTNVDPDYTGVDISLNDNHIGQIVGLDIPDDIDDIESNIAFDTEVEDWIIENER